jgi:hypothetical protein
MINENLDVQICQASGTMCIFEGVTYKPGIAKQALELIATDCAGVPQLHSVQLKILDGLVNPNDSYILKRNSKDQSKDLFLLILRSMKVPHGSGGITNGTIPYFLYRRTMHKLQSRSQDNVLMNS